jgi:drug/metabolite transporter (DMT)-like permease
MEPLIAGIVLFSAILHPARDSILRSDTRPATAYLAMVVVVLLISGSHVILADKDLISVLEVWPLMAISLTAMTIYSLSLVLTFSRGDLSIYYPITRSSPLFIVAVGVVFLGQAYSWLTLSGIGLVIAGGFLLQCRWGRKLIYEPATLSFALLTMAAHGTGAITDGYAVRVIDPAVWFFWNWLLQTPLLVLLFRYVVSTRVEWPPFAHWRRGCLRYLVGGATLYFSYYLMLVAYSLGGNVAAVTAVRQASIPFAVLIGGTLLSESGMARRLLFSLIIACGIVIIVFSD